MLSRFCQFLIILSLLVPAPLWAQPPGVWQFEDGASQSGGIWTPESLSEHRPLRLPDSAQNSLWPAQKPLPYERPRVRAGMPEFAPVPRSNPQAPHFAPHPHPHNGFQTPRFQPRFPGNPRPAQTQPAPQLQTQYPTHVSQPRAAPLSQPGPQLPLFQHAGSIAPAMRHAGGITPNTGVYRQLHHQLPPQPARWSEGFGSQAASLPASAPLQPMSPAVPYPN